MVCGENTRKTLQVTEKTKAANVIELRLENARVDA